MAREPSITEKGIEFALQGVLDRVSKARLNGSFTTNITSKAIEGNQLFIEFSVLEEEVDEITKIELMDSSNNVISGTTSNVYIQVIDDVNIKSVFTLRQEV